MAWSEWKNVGYTNFEHITTIRRAPAVGMSTYSYVCVKDGIFDARVMFASNSGYNPIYASASATKNGVNIPNSFKNTVSNTVVYGFFIDALIGDVINIMYGLTSQDANFATNDNHVATIDFMF